MITFIVFFLTVLIVFLIANKLQVNKDIDRVTSTIDKRDYLVRKLPDAQKASDKLAVLNRNVLRLMDFLKDDPRKDIQKLRKRYDPDQLSETAPDAKYTSYSVNKGESIAMCLRHPDNTFMDMNVIHFVMLHELSHVMTHEVGHTPLFWKNMGYLLKKGEELGIYEVVDYGKTPVKYCGVIIDSTPYEFEESKESSEESEDDTSKEKSD